MLIGILDNILWAVVNVVFICTWFYAQDQQNEFVFKGSSMFPLYTYELDFNWNVDEIEWYGIKFYEIDFHVYGVWGFHVDKILIWSWKYARD